MSAKKRVVLTRRWPEPVERELMARYRVEVNERDVPMPAQDIAAALANADAVCPTVTDRIDASVLAAAAPGARILANFGVGFNHIDLDAARRHGVVVTNTPGVLTESTADLAMALILMSARRLAAGATEVATDNWDGWRPTHLLGTDVHGKTLGLVGFGRIARAVARRAHAGFGMRVLFVTPRPPPATDAAKLGASACRTLAEMLPQCDFLSLHCPGGEATRDLIDAAELALLPPHAFVINTARGDVLNEAALIQALRDGTIAGAGLDVYAAEPTVPAALRNADNVVALPHLGSATVATRTAMGRRAAANLEAFFSGAEPPDRIA